MLAKQLKVETIKVKKGDLKKNIGKVSKRRFSERLWKKQNEENREKGRPSIKLEKEDNDFLSI